MKEQKGSTNKFDTPQANYISANFVEALVACRFLSVPELVEGPEPLPLRLGVSSSDLVSGRDFFKQRAQRQVYLTMPSHEKKHEIITHTKTTKCELASLKQHILLNVFAHINLFPTSTKCRQIESPKRLSDSTIKRFINLIKKTVHFFGY